MAQPTGRRKKVPSPLGKLCPTGKRPWDTDLVSVLIGTTERGTPEVMAICLSFSNNHGSMGLSLDWPASESDHLPKRKLGGHSASPRAFLPFSQPQPDTGPDHRRRLAVNLDAMTPDDLWEIHNRLHQHPVLEARKLFPEKPQGYVAAAHTLKNYCANKAVAMKLRLEGRIAVALRYEAICERLYGELPDFARW